MIFLNVIRVIAIILLALLAGKLLAKIHLPAVLGFLIAGMVFGPYAVNLLSQEIIDAEWYRTVIHFAECTMGLMIGSELVWSQLRKLGKQIFVTTLTQSLGTFLVVSASFSLVFWLIGIPPFLGMIFGGIALATAPAPALSIVSEYKTDGPVTKSLIPMAALDDIVAIMVFLLVMTFTLHKTTGGKIPLYMMLLVVVIPAAIGLLIGYLTTALIKRMPNKNAKIALVWVGVLLCGVLTMLANTFIMPLPILNFMLTGMAYSAVYANMVTESELKEITEGTDPAIKLCFVIVILNLGASLDYHMIAKAGAFTALYILARAAGKIGGAAFGAHITAAPKTVKKYLGFTLLPHSGVSLVLTGIAVSVLSGWNNEYANIVRGTIAAAAVINEIIAVILAKWAFKKAGEMGKAS